MGCASLILYCIRCKVPTSIGYSILEQNIMTVVYKYIIFFEKKQKQYYSPLISEPLLFFFFASSPFFMHIEYNRKGYRRQKGGKIYLKNYKSESAEMYNIIRKILVFFFFLASSVTILILISPFRYRPTTWIQSRHNSWAAGGSRFPTTARRTAAEATRWPPRCTIWASGRSAAARRRRARWPVPGASLRPRRPHAAACGRRSGAAGGPWRNRRALRWTLDPRPRRYARSYCCCCDGGSDCGTSSLSTRSRLLRRDNRLMKTRRAPITDYNVWRRQHASNTYAPADRTGLKRDDVRLQPRGTRSERAHAVQRHAATTDRPYSVFNVFIIIAVVVNYYFRSMMIRFFVSAVRWNDNFFKDKSSIHCNILYRSTLYINPQEPSSALQTVILCTSVSK